jgi:hypothetical protein
MNLASVIADKYRGNMKKDVRKRIFTRLQASVAVFALMLGWLSPVAPSMANELF